MKSVILLSGPLGAGKTTVAKQLVELSAGQVAYIEGDKFWFFIAKGGEIAGRFKNFKTIMQAMTKASIPYALADYEVILDFSVPPWYLDTIKKILDRREISLHYVVLRPSEQVCAYRAAARIEGTITSYSPYKDFYASFDEAARFTICDNESEAEVIAIRIRNGVDEGIFKV